MQSKEKLEDMINKGYYDGVIKLGKEVGIDFQKINYLKLTMKEDRDLFRKFRRHIVKRQNKIWEIKLSEHYILLNLEKVCDMFRNPLLQCFLFIQ